MKNIIRKIQKQSYLTRLILLWVSVGISMFLIGSVWINSLKNSLAETPTALKQIEKPLGELPSLKNYLESSLKDLQTK